MIKDTYKFLEKIALRSIYLLGIICFPLLFLSVCYYENNIKHPEMSGIIANITQGVFSPEIYKEYAIHLSSAILIGFVATLLFRKINDFVLDEKLGEVIKKVETIYPKNINALQYMKVEKGLYHAIYHLENSDYKYIYVIGTGKSELENEFSIIKTYWQKTEQKLKKTNSVKYKRMTAYSISKSFKVHLVNCLNTNRSSVNTKIIFMDDFAVANTFLIIGDKFLFISPTSLDDENQEVSQDCFITEDFYIIEEYKKHFNSIWSRAKKHHKEITNEQEFNTILKQPY